MITDALHFSFTVSNVDESIAWYTEVLGLELVHREEQFNSDNRQPVGIKYAVLQVAQFNLPGVTSLYSTHMLELVEYQEGGDPTEASLPANRSDVAHLAFIVNDFEERYRRMTAAGVTFKNLPTPMTHGSNVGVLRCYLVDPDGITIELRQFSDSRAEAGGIPLVLDENKAQLAGVNLRTIAGNTQLIFVVADPVSQLRAPQALNEAWMERDLDLVTVPAHVRAADLEAFLTGIRANASCLGAVLTVPHKSAAVKHCNELGAGAVAAGAVNVIRRREDGSLFGETFDGKGFVAGLSAVGLSCQGVPAVIFGAGGAASAIAAALLEAGVPRLDVVNRSERRAMELVDKLRELFPDRDLGTGATRSLSAGLIVNATSVGMAPADDSPVPAHLIPASCIAADVVMSTKLTPFLVAAKSSGAIVHEGHHMLEGQLRLIADFFDDSQAVSQ
jgi:shikimate dehydrogenase